MDITYLPMAHGFVYLAAVLDWYSRKVRVPAHDGQDSGAMADTVPVAWRTVFRPDGGQFRCGTGRVSAMMSERCPR